MPVEVGARTVVAHRGVWVGVACGDLDVVQVQQDRAADSVLDGAVDGSADRGR